MQALLHSLRAAHLLLKPGRVQSSRSILSSPVSTATRLPGVSDRSIAAKASAPARKFSSVSKYWSTTAVRCASSKTSWSFLIGTPGGGPVSSILATSDSTRSAVTSVNRTTRTNTTLSRRLTGPSSRSQGWQAKRTTVGDSATVMSTAQ